MSDFFIGEIRAFPFGIVPRGWHLCDGALLQVSQNQALYSLLGVQFGGSPGSNFNLPDLRGRAMLDAGTLGTNTYAVGNKAGAESITLTQAQMPQHNHIFQADKATTNLVANPNNALPAAPTTACYAAQAQVPGATMAANSLSLVGGGQAHNNMQPSLVINYCIATSGIYPSRG